MKKILAVLAVVATLAAPAVSQAQAAPKKYLVLGADPQAKNRQPTADEEIVIIDHDLCDSGWGSGSGKKVAGCYPVNSAVIRDKATGFVVAMYVCGNDPSDKHTVTGKVVPAAEVVYIPGPQGPPGPAGPQGISGLRGFSGADGVSAPPKFEYSGISKEKEKHWYGFCSHGTAQTVTCVVGGLLLGAVIHNNWPDDEKKAPQGVPPGGHTGPAFQIAR